MILVVCNSASFAETLDLLEKGLLLFEIILPVILFVYITKEFIKVSKNKEERKLIKKINAKFILLVILYLIPAIFIASMYFLGDKNNLSSCWNNNLEVPQEEVTEEPVEEEEPEEETPIDENASYVIGEGSSELAYSIAELAVKVAPVANPTFGFQADAWLGHGVDRATTDKRMHDYIKIMDATVTDKVDDTSNPNYHIGYNNPAYCSCAQAAGAIVRATVDPDFDTYNSCAQMDYIEKHPTKWIKVGVIRAGDSFEKYCKPGDLLIAGEKDPAGGCNNSHTMIYIGNELAKTRFSNTKGNMFQAIYNAAEGGKNSTCPAIDLYVKDIMDYSVYRPLEGGESYYKKIDVDKVLSSKMKTGSFWGKME